MTVKLSSDAEEDIRIGYNFYEQQSEGLGSYFRDCLVADIGSLEFYAGIHEVTYGYHRMLAKRFPYVIYYQIESDNDATVVAVLDARQRPAHIKDRLEG